MNEASFINAMRSQSAGFNGVSFNTRDRSTRRFDREDFS
jgi:hypothetical protein